MLYRITLIFSLALYASISNALVIDFDTQEDGVYWRSVVSDNGFVFNSLQNDASMGTGQSIDESGFSNSTVHLFDWTNKKSKNAKSSFQMTASDQSLFSLHGFDYVSGYLDGEDLSDQLKVKGFDASGNKVAERKFVKGEGDYSHTYFTYLTLDETFSNLSFAVFEAKGADSRSGYDNFSVSKVVSVVEEPASLGLFALGLLALFFLGRRSE